MAAGDAGVRPKGRLSPHVRGHLFLFDGMPAPAIGANAGRRLVVAAVLVEVVRLAAVRSLRPAVPLWLLLPLLFGIALLSVRAIAGVEPSRLGFRPWREWTTTEKSYFLQVLVIANVVFPVVLAVPLRQLLAQPSGARMLWSVFVPYLFFGFYQEVVYRGMLQLDLVRRWGAGVGVLVANLAYTFGALHYRYFASPASSAVPMFASIFLIGLLFGVVYRRSGNLWIVAGFHGVGSAYIVGSLGPLSS